MAKNKFIKNFESFSHNLKLSNFNIDPSDIESYFIDFIDEEFEVHVKTLDEIIQYKKDSKYSIVFKIIRYIEVSIIPPKGKKISDIFSNQNLSLLFNEISGRLSEHDLTVLEIIKEDHIKYLIYKNSDKKYLDKK